MNTATQRRGAQEGTGAPAVAAFTTVTKSYGQVRAVDGLDLTLRAGETVALLGPNGAGKSSALDLLLGLRNPDSGTVQLFGGTPQQAIAAGRVGAMLQSGGLMPEVKVRELVQFACDVHPRAYPVDQVLMTAGIADIADRKTEGLSGGQKQRVRFALATAGANDLVVLDEPTVAMDVSARQAFWGTMKTQAAAGRTVLFATHYLEEADSVADRILVLQHGRLIADGTPADIKARAGVRRVVFDLDGGATRHEQLLRAMPGVSTLEVHGRTVRIRATDADATVAAIYQAGLYPQNLEVAGLGLEQAFLAITNEETATRATSAEENVR